MKLRTVPGLWGKLPEYLEKTSGDREQAVSLILEQMSLDEKISQMNGDQPLVRGTLEMMTRYNREPIPAGENFRLGIPGIRFTDGPRGAVLYSSTCFPVAMARGASWDTELEERIGNAIGIEARAQGANFFGGVCVNLLRHPAWGRAQETYGEDPYHLGEMGASLIRGVQRHIIACVKHYACNSVENTRFKINVRIDERTLREFYLPHFKRCIDEGVAAVMSAYNKVNGDYCGENRLLLREILKEEWGFSGFVVSDFLFGLYDGRKGIEAGLDIEMPFRRKYGRKLKLLVDADIVDESLINQRVSGILRQKLRFAEVGNDEAFYTREKVVCKAHTDLAREAAEKSMVLLKNEGPLLPLDAPRLRRIALVGKLAGIANIGDRGSSRVFPPYAVSPAEGLTRLIRDKGLNDDVEMVSYFGNNPKQAAGAVEAADVCIVVVGCTWKDEGENMMRTGGDRASLRLKPEEEALIRKVAEKNPKTVVVIESGSSIIMGGWLKSVPAVLMAWYPGMEGGNALARVLFGEVNPGGKLPFVIPEKEEDLPFFDAGALEIEYGYYHGYRLLQKNKRKPAFPFGFGLSYTEFNYGAFRLATGTVAKDGTINATVVIENIGECRGEEVIQIYSSQKNPGLKRPAMELKDFSKVLLEPGEKKEVEFAVPSSRLGYYHPGKGRWTVEEGEYILHAGPSSDIERCKKTELRIIA